MKYQSENERSVSPEEADQDFQETQFSNRIVIGQVAGRTGWVTFSKLIS